MEIFYFSSLPYVLSMLRIVCGRKTLLFLLQNEREAMNNSNSTMLIFPSPPANQMKPLFFIILDNLNKSFNFQYVEDPHFNPFPNGILVLKQASIILAVSG